MSPEKKPSVLVCVTGQYDCDRLINVASSLAQMQGMELHVLCVHTPISNVSFISEQIEYLYQTSKKLGADMTIAFNNDPPSTAADFAKKINAKVIVTGVPGHNSSGFVDDVHELLPQSDITMVTKEGELVTHCVECSVRATA